MNAGAVAEDELLLRNLARIESSSIDLRTVDDLDPESLKLLVEARTEAFLVARLEQLRAGMNELQSSTSATPHEV